MTQNSESNFNFLLIGESTDVGKVRKANEDSMTVFEVANMKVFVVCDGMGGHVGGQVASQTAITAIRDFLINNTIVDPQEAIHNSIMVANEAILNRARQQPELARMGSTCVMLVVTNDGKVYYGHVGDSRVYIIADRIITLLTDDHSVVFEMYKAGAIKTREDMEKHPRKNEITNALGIQDMKPPTVCRAHIEPNSGNCFLLCSDGLTGMVSDERIQRIISKHDIPIQQRAEKLVQMANDNGGVDNITVQLVEFAVGTQQLNSNAPEKTIDWKKMLIYAIPILLLLMGFGWFIWNKIKPAETELVEYIEGLVNLPAFFTQEVEFKANDDINVEILNFPVDSLYIDIESVRTSSNIKAGIAKISGNYHVTIKWGRTRPPLDAIIIKFLTTDEKYYCTVEVPIKAARVSTQQEVIKDVKLETAITLVYNKNERLNFPPERKNEWTILTNGKKEIENKYKSYIECNVLFFQLAGETKNKEINIRLLKPDYPYKEIVFLERTRTETYRFIIPVKTEEGIELELPSYDENCEENHVEPEDEVKNEENVEEETVDNDDIEE